MNKKLLKITIFFIILWSCILIKNCTLAASASIKASTSSAKVRDTVTVTVSGNAAGWDVKVTANGPVTANGDTNFANVTDNAENANVTMGVINYTVTGEGNILFTLSGYLVDSNSPENKTCASGTASVQVQKKEEPKQDPPANQTPPQEQQPKQEPEATYQAVNDTIYSANGTLNIRSGPSTSHSIVGSLEKGKPLTRTGIGSNGWDKVSFNGSVAYINHALITTTKPEDEPKPVDKSTIKALKELKAEGYDLNPAFNPEVTKYTINLDEDETEDSLKLTATPENEKASVNIEGNENFTPGNNMVKITVTAEDGTARIYTITVVKSSKILSGDELRLSALEIANATLEPAFSPEITNYIIHIEDPSSIKAQNFLATPADADVTVTTAENSLSENGEKVIVFMLQSKDGKKNGTYQIAVKKPAAKVENMIKKDNDKTIYYMLGGTIGVLVILIIIIIIALKKTAEVEDAENAEDADKDENYEDDKINTDIEEDNLQNNKFKYTAQPLNKKIKDFDLDNDNDNKSESSIEKTKAFKFELDNVEDNENIDIAEKKKGKHF